MSRKSPAVIWSFPGEKVDQYLKLVGALPGEFDDTEIIASARRIVDMVDAVCPDRNGKPHRAKTATVYRVLTAFLSVAEPKS